MVKGLIRTYNLRLADTSHHRLEYLFYLMWKTDNDV